jgi:hypothetical protein
MNGEVQGSWGKKEFLKRPGSRVEHAIFLFKTHVLDCNVPDRIGSRKQTTCSPYSYFAAINFAWRSSCEAPKVTVGRGRCCNVEC